MRLKEAEKIRKLYNEKDFTQKQIADEMGLTQGCISKKMKEYGIDSDYKGFWTDAEEERMREIYGKKTKEEIVSEFPDRTWNAIKLKAMDLGFAKSIEEHRNSEEVRDTLIENARQNAVEVDFEKVEALSYVLGVADGDGYNDNKGTIGLEVKNPDFADKFARKLESIGLNPGRGQRRGKETVWASSKELVNWINNFDFKSKIKWLFEEGDSWSYIEGIYDSDGDFSHISPRICSYDPEEKVFIKKILNRKGLDCSIQSNNVYVKAESKQKFFENVDPVYEKRKP